ncbi:MAG: nucleoside triphosphate diphosphatase [Mycobacterium sp.]|jgi:XTP/dITP diphosphohydrolase|nr:nucleoside triphosphate diphosphatase [Mycobacterium sp.]
MTVVLVDPRRPSLLPVEAIALLVGDVQYTEEMPVKVPWSLPASRPAYTGEDAPVLLSSDPNHPMVKARLAAGATLISVPAPHPGERLLDAVAIMDTLRTSGPWEGEQTHDSLRRYLLEETYELFDAVRSGNSDELREELGDVLLQVLFHARIAEDALELPFGIDDVADALVRKLGNRVPAVLAGEAISLEEQLAQWEERKATESSVKARVSTVDDVPTAQPALALTQKVYERVAAAGLPVDLIPEGLLTIGVALGGDAENALRTQTLEFMDTVRKVEQNIIASRRKPDVPEELDSAPLGVVTEDEWRAHWPTGERCDEKPDVDEGPSEPEESDEDEDEDPKAVVEEPDPQSEGVDEVADEPDLVDHDSSVEPQ